MGSSTIRTTASPMPSSMATCPQRPISSATGLPLRAVCSFFTSIIGLIFSIIGLNQIKRQGGKGKGLAIAGIIISVAKLGIYLLLIVMIIVGLFSGMVDAVTNDLRSDYSYSRYDDMDDQYDSYYYDGQYDYDDSGDIDIDDLDRALEQLNGVSEWSSAFTVYSPAVSISE